MLLTDSRAEDDKRRGKASRDDLLVVLKKPLVVLPFLGIAVLASTFLFAEVERSEQISSAAAAARVLAATASITDAIDLMRDAEELGPAVNSLRLSKTTRSLTENLFVLSDISSDGVRHAELSELATAVRLQSETVLKTIEETKRKPSGIADEPTLASAASASKLEMLANEAHGSRTKAEQLVARYTSLVQSQCGQICIIAGLVSLLVVVLAITLLSSIREELTKVRQTRHSNGLEDAVVSPDISVSAVCNESALQLYLDETVVRLQRSSVQLQSSQATLKLIMQKMPAALIITDNTGRIRFTNQFAQSCLAADAQALRGSSIHHLLRTPAGQEYKFEQLIDCAGKLLVADVVCFDGQYRKLELTMDSLPGTKSSYVFIAFDVSERQKWMQLKDRLTSMLAHDMAAPIMLVSDLLAKLEGTDGDSTDRTDDGDSKRALIRTASAQAERLTKMFQDLLRLGNSVLDEQPLKISAVNLKSLLREAVNACCSKAEDRQVELLLRCGEFSVDIDVDRFMRVAMNLILNAIKFSPPGSTVTITGAQGSDCFQLMVTDEGCGIPENLQQSIFKPYRQVPVIGAAAGGSGLGLAICTKIVEMHGGTISVENNSECGATFRVKIPQVNFNDRENDREQAEATKKRMEIVISGAKPE